MSLVPSLNFSGLGSALCSWAENTELKVLGYSSSADISGVKLLSKKKKKNPYYK